MQTRHKFTCAASACFGALALLAPVEGWSQARPTAGGKLIASMIGDPTSINPVISSNGPDRQTGCAVHQGIVDLTTEYKVVPLLAKSWTISPDSLTYTFDLRTDVTWHDGTRFTSEDVAFSLVEASAKYSSIFAAAGRAIDKVETPAPDKVVVKLKYPFGPFLISLTCEQGGAILPVHLYKGTNIPQNPVNSKPVGTGPLKFSEWKRGEFVRLVKNDKYFEPGKPYLDELIFKIIPLAGMRLQALQAGEIDFIPNMAASDIDAVKRNPKLKVVDRDTAPLSSMAFFNVSRKPLEDKRVRHALMMATDRDYIFKTAFFGLGTVGTMPFPSLIQWAAAPNIDYNKKYAFNPDRANALLDEAGVKRGANGTRFSLKIVVVSSQYPEFHQVAQALQSMWKNVGVDVSVDQVENPVWIKRVFTDGDFDVTLMNYASYSDPALGVTRSFISTSIGKSYGNASRYSNPKVDELFAKGERPVEYEKRAAAYREAQEILAEDLPVIQLRQYTEKHAVTRRFNGLWGAYQGNGRWSDAYLDK